MTTNTLLKTNNQRVSDWPKWKHSAFLALVFVLGILVGRLLIDQWRLVTGVVLVLCDLAAIVWSERSQQRAKEKKREGK